MLRTEYSQKDRDFFQKMRYDYPDARIQRRFDILWLHSRGMNAEKIAPLVQLNPYTVRGVIKMYQKGGIELVTTIGSYRPESELQNHKASIIKEFTDHPPASAKEAAHRIEKLTGIKRSEQQVRVFMKGIGMKCRRTAAIPAKADVQKQAKFVEEEIEPEIASAKAGKSVLLYMDSAHFVQAAFLGVLWCFTRIFVRSPSGRKRWNVLGAYNAITGQLTTVANDGYITATTVCEMLGKLAVQYASQKIVIVLDNARYQRCKLVDDLAKELGITLLFLPSYSPNLNLIERLWKFVKKKCLYNHYYATFDEFTAAINNCLDQVNTHHKHELKTLMTLKFQSFENVSLLAL